MKTGSKADLVRQHEAAGWTAESRATTPSRTVGGIMSPGWYADRAAGAGVYVDEQVALQYAALWRCVTLVSQTIGVLGFNVMRRQDRTRSVLTDDPVRWLLMGQANPEMSGATFRELLTAWLMTWGNGYAEIERSRAGVPLALWPLHPSQVDVKRRADGTLYYQYAQEAGRTIELPPNDVFHVRGPSPDGLKGYSPVQVFRNTIGLGMATERYGANYFGNGSMPGGVLTTDKEINAEKLTRLREDWERLHRGPTNAGRVAILEDGLKWAQVTLPNDVSQFLESRRFQVIEIARMYGVPPHKLMDLEHGNYSNLEHQGIEWTTDGVLPPVKRWETEIDIKLLGRSRMMQGDYARFNIDSLMRGDSTQRANFYRTMTGIGVFSINDVCELEDRDPVDGGDLRLVPMNMVPLEDAREAWKAKAGGTIPGTPRADGPPGGDGNNEGSDT